MLYSILFYSATLATISASPLRTDGSYPIDIGPWSNNKAFGENGNFDQIGTHFTDPSFQNSALRINYLPSKSNTAQDNLQQVDDNSLSIALPKISTSAVYMLVSASHGPSTVDMVVKYSDNTSETTTLSLPDWQDGHIDQMERYQAISYPISPTDNRLGWLFSAPIYINPNKQADQIVLPPKDGEAAVHVFAMTSYPTQPGLMVTHVRVTEEWVDSHYQTIAVTLHNLSKKWIRNTDVQLTGSHVSTLHGGRVEAVAPGHVHTTRIVVRAHHAGQHDVQVVCSSSSDENNKHCLNENAKLNLRSVKRYEATSESVMQHRSPQWLQQSKFGIFIHWGLYSVPAWAPVGESYAEWYWWRMNHKNDAAFKYHRDTYGQDFEYDDFLTRWKPDQFKPKKWLDLVHQSGAKYFVFTTKHHDGIALFDTNVTDRSTSHLLFPSRDFVRELMDVSQKDYPHLKRGLYFSLPEWYHPKYKDESLGWQGPPINPYNGKRVPYTGSREIDSFVNELQVPQFEELTGSYDPDIIWCDIGGIHNSSVWQHKYFNRALERGRQVAVNDRCGDTSGSDFTTIEYKAVSDTPSRFWESTRGMDPLSFGYNQETPAEAYASATDLIKDLVNAVSRGGNFLLNIGPKASGEVPQPMIERLLDMGQWLQAVNSSIFETVPYWITSLKDNYRFTASQDGKSIYIFSLNELEGKRNHSLVVDVPLPIDQSTTKITLMNANNTVVEWSQDTAGRLVLNFALPKDVSIPVFQVTD